MAGMMTFIDGSVEAVTTYDDFVFYVGKYMGQEAKDYISDMVADLVYYEGKQDDIDEMKKFVNDFKYKYITLEQEFRDFKAQFDKIREFEYYPTREDAICTEQ